MKFFAFIAALATLAASALAAPSESKRDSCVAGSYRCDANGHSIDVCNAQGQWEVAGDCPDDDVCHYLPHNGSVLPYCVKPTEKRDSAPEQCAPATYTCAHNPSTGANGINVCDSEHKWEYVGDCPGDSHCEYFPSGIPFCVAN